MGNSRHDLSIPKDYFMKDKAKLLYVSSSTYGGDWISTPHTHYCSELFYVLDGVGQFQVEDRIFPVSANDLVIINPNVSHTELGFHANPLKYIVLGIENLELSVANEGENFCIVSFREIKETMNFYLKMMLREIETRAPGYEAVCQDLMEILIVLFGRQTNFKTILTPTNKNPLTCVNLSGAISTQTAVRIFRWSSWRSFRMSTNIIWCMHFPTCTAFLRSTI